jgi:DNA-binding transcriptional ArsR family regulator
MLDPNFMSALGHPARLQALVLFEQRPASAREVAAIVDLSPSATAYHVRKLYEAGLIEQVDTRHRRAFEERVWRTRRRRRALARRHVVGRFCQVSTGRARK